MADREKSHETSCKNRAVLYRKISHTGLLKVSCDTFYSLSHGETSFMKPNPMRLVASCDKTFRDIHVVFIFDMYTPLTMRSVTRYDKKLELIELECTQMELT